MHAEPKVYQHESRVKFPAKIEIKHSVLELYSALSSKGEDVVISPELERILLGLIHMDRSSLIGRTQELVEVTFRSYGEENPFLDIVDQAISQGLKPVAVETALQLGLTVLDNYPIKYIVAVESTSSMLSPFYMHIDHLSPDLKFKKTSRSYFSIGGGWARTEFIFARG